MQSKGIEPGAATTVACGRLATLKKKFVSQLQDEEKHFAEQSTEYTTKLCEGPGCEPDPAKRESAQGEWLLIKARHDEKAGHLKGLLEDIEEIIESVPFRRCPEFEDYLADKHTNAHGKGLLDSAQAAVGL